MSSNAANTSSAPSAAAPSASAVKSAARSSGNNNNNNNGGRRNNGNSARSTASGGANHRRGGGGGGGGGGDQARKGTNDAPPVAPAAASATGEVEPEETGECCVVCFKVVEIFSIGECDHPVCYECSTRMRVLCKQNECPICRTDLSKVIFTLDVLTFRQLEINNRTGLYDKKHRICFAALRCQEAYNKLLESPCTLCNQNFANFAALREHVKKKHERHYCDICTANLSIFSFERRSYNRVDLGIHRRKGDADDTSHRGHPLCEYCDVRFFDRDELYKHLRREHFYCHFCDADGANCYYADYAALRVHFKSDHFLCEDGECAQEQFTAVFRTEIDLRAHIHSMHSSGLSRQAARQNRTLDFEITLAPRVANGAAAAAAAAAAARGHRDTQNEFDAPSQSHAQSHHGGGQTSQHVQQAPQRTIDARNENEFPSLGGGTSSGIGAFTLQPLVRAYGGTRGIARTLDNFPALGGAGAPAAVPSNSGGGAAYKKTASALLKSNSGGQATASNSSAGAFQVASNKSKSSGSTTRPQDFPSLGGSSQNAGPAAKSKRGGASLFLDEDFAPLPNTAADYSGSISSKHRTLLSNGYESALTSGTADTKLGMVKRAAEVATKKAEAAPKISSKQNFPTLGNAPSAAMAAQWVSLGGGTKKAPVESRKSKVAPPPLSTTTTTSQAPSANKSKVAAPVTTKKATDGKKPASASSTANTTNATKPSSAPAAAASRTTPSASKPKQKNYNPFETDSDEEVDKFVPSTAVMSAVSSKHRGLVDSYESVAKTGGTKLSLVQQRNDAPKVSPTKAAPKLSSADNFPSLGGGGPAAASSAYGGVNFMNIVKASNAAAATGKKGNHNDNNNDISSYNNNNNNNSSARAPPGFGGATTTTTTISAPPGFNRTALTPSSGVDQSQQQYRAPPNSARRNQALFAHVQTIGDQVVVNSFKQVSQMFISDAYKAEPYYEHCRTALAGRFEELFPELLALLPNIDKQQELHLVHSQQQQTKTGAKPKNNKRNSGGTLEVCATCKQVLVAADLIGHVQSHALENNFPTLSLRSGNGTASAWKNASVLGTPSRSAAQASQANIKATGPRVAAVAALVVAVFCWWFCATSDGVE